jgi:hypothetical protein
VTIAHLDVPLHGGCLCGRVRYRIVEDPIAFYLCHCTDCQCESGSAFGLSMALRRSALEHERGEVRSIVVELPDAVRRWPATVCANCLVRLWGESLRSPNIVGLSPGTLDDPKAYEPFGNIWTRSARPPGLFARGPCFERQPEDPIAMVKIWQEQRRALRDAR